MSAFRYVIVAILSCAMAAPALARSPTRVLVLASPSPSKVGRSVTISAEVDGLGGGAPVGTVTIADGSVALGRVALSPRGAGQATLSAGVRFTCSLTEAGGAACWGINDSGRLGDGATTTRITPAPVSGLSRGVVAVAAGYAQACALTTAGAVKCWGTGALGNGTTSSLTPVAVTGLSSGVVAITDRCALTSAGAVKCWGQYGPRVRIQTVRGLDSEKSRHGPRPRPRLSVDERAARRLATASRRLRRRRVAHLHHRIGRSHRSALTGAPPRSANLTGAPPRSAKEYSSCALSHF